MYGEFFKEFAWFNEKREKKGLLRVTSDEKWTHPPPKSGPTIGKFFRVATWQHFFIESRQGLSRGLVQEKVVSKSFPWIT